MTETEWIAQARADREILISFVESYHPSTLGRVAPLPITAKRAEQAAREVRDEIRRKTVGSPVANLSAALDAGNVGGVYSVLNGAWFGVPESTDCWSIRGFKEAVALLEDPPE